MNTSADSLFFDILRGGCVATLAIGGLAVLSARAQASTQIDEISVSAPSVQKVGRDIATDTPIEKVTVTARVSVDPATLTTKSGVAELKKSVMKAAHEVCTKTDPLLLNDGPCVRAAMHSARPQVTALITEARNNGGTNG